MKDTLSVLIPTLNSRSLLQAHVESMRPWLEMADEIIVVDSHSTDGTVDYLRSQLSSFPLQIHLHPKGLYQSWNHGISLAKGTWLYISTIGDSITREHLAHQLDLAEKCTADLVISVPDWIDEAGAATRTVPWAVSDIVERLTLSCPCILTGAATFFFAVLHTYSSAISGSVASDIFRTEHLQKFPFPTEYGMSGDGAWGLKHAYETRCVVTPRRGSTFRIHAKSYALADYHVEELAEKLGNLAQSIQEKQLSRSTQDPFNLPDVLRLAKAKSQRYAELKRLRQKNRLWYFSGQTWAARMAYKQTVRDLDTLFRKNVEQIRAGHAVFVAD
jgi:glycosyltransferase involved in cell wall biosynthesis